MADRGRMHDLAGEGYAQPMSSQRLLELYDRVADAPDAVEMLRKFVLDLAVRGKLVEQNERDEPADALLERIEAEKASLHRVGQIKKPKKLPKVEECPYPLPTNWRWTRIRQVTSDRGQKVPDQRFTYIDVSAIDKEAGVVSEPKILDPNDAPSRARKITSRGDLIYSCVRPYLLNIAVIDHDFDPEPIVSTAFAVLNGHGLVLPWYLWIVLRSPFMIENVEAKQRGQAYPAINDKDFSILLFPLAPLEEQQRIVAKVNELMVLLDRLETTRTQRETTRNRLTSVSLTRLTAPETTEADFPTHARFAVENLHELTTRADQIEGLHQTILGLAVYGKLVEQDKMENRSNQSALRPDESAENYDWRAFRERAEEFELPQNWTIEPLSRVAENIVDCPHTTPEWTERGILCIKTNQVRAGVLDLSSPIYVSEETYKKRIDRLEPQEGDILYLREGGVLGVCCRIPPETRLCMGQRLMLIRPNCSVTSEFLELCLNSPWIADYASQKTTGGAAPRVNMSLVRGYPIPIPPIAEQHRILERVDTLKKHCDRLTDFIVASDTIRAELLQILLSEALLEKFQTRPAA